jgi:hypothetical protein
MSNINSLKEIYQEHLKEESYQKYHQIIFKVDLNSENNPIQDENIIIQNLKTLQIIDWMPFLNKIGLVVEDYYVRFMINSLGQYFIKLSIVYPSIGTILEYKNSLCLLPGCPEKIFNYWSCFCEYHGSTPDIINNTNLVNQYFENRSEELKKLHQSYQKQENLVHYLKTQFDTPTFELTSLHLDPNISCHLSIIYNESNLTDIDIEDDIELDQYMLNSTIHDDDDIINHSTLEDILQLFEKDPSDINLEQLDESKEESKEEPRDELEQLDESKEESKEEPRDELEQLDESKEEPRDELEQLEEFKKEPRDELEQLEEFKKEPRDELEQLEENLNVDLEDLDECDSKDNEGISEDELDEYLKPSNNNEGGSSDFFDSESEMSDDDDYDISRKELEEMIEELAQHHLKNMNKK